MAPLVLCRRLSVHQHAADLHDVFHGEGWRVKGPQYIVVEMSGMVGEFDVGRFGTYMAAANYIERKYSKAERDQFDPNCLWPDICVEIDGTRTYEV